MTPVLRSLTGAALLVALVALPGHAQQTRQLTPIAAPPSQSTTNVPEPPQAPALRIDADFHTQVVNRFAQDESDRIIVTGSDDKTIRFWQADNGAPLATLRVPIAPGDEGAIYAVAISPDGKTLLAGGNTGYTWDKSFVIYLFDLTTSRLKGRLPDLPGPINDIAYAPDGRTFAVAMGNGGGMRVIDASNGSMVSSDISFHQRVTSVAYDTRGRLYATGFDGEVHAYDATGRRVAQRTPVPNGQPYSVAVSPDGRTIAVGYADQPRVELLNASDLSTRASLNTDPSGKRDPTANKGLLAVAWGPDSSIWAAGSLLGKDGHAVIRHWGPGGTGRPTDLSGPKDTVFQLRATPDGGVILVSADPALMRLDRRGQTVFRDASPAVAMRDLQDRPMRVSQDGMSVRLQTTAMAEPWTVDLTRRHVGPNTTRALTPIAADDAVNPPGPRPDVTEWRNSATPKIGGQLARLAPEELSRSYAATQSGDMVLLGTDYRLRVYRRDGTPLAAVELPGTVWGVGVSGDGKIAVAAVGDGTLRWFGLDRSGELTPRVSIFLAADARRWVAWTPAAYFDYSDTGGVGLAGVLINHARNQSPEWFSFSQIYRRFYAPDTVLADLRGTDANPVSDRRSPLAGPPSTNAPAITASTVRQDILQTPPPVIDVRSVCWLDINGRQCKQLASSKLTRSLTVVAAPSATPSSTDASDVIVPAEAESLTVQYGLRGEQGASSTVDLFVNGINSSRAVRDVSNDGSKMLDQTVKLETGMNRIQIRAYDRTQQTYAVSRTVEIVRSISTTGAEGKSRPDLYILSVGINNYTSADPDEIPHLDYAAPDAASVTHAIQKHMPDQYGRVEMTELYDEKASTQGVLRALNDIADRASARDTVLIYLSGHGYTLDQRYYFITQNVHTVASVPTTALSEGALVKALSSIRSKNTMLFLDTCHAGAFSLDSTQQLEHETGRYVLAGSASVESALDSYDNKNGVFATAILRGLAGRAAKGQDSVDNFELGFYVQPLVAQLAREKHHDQSARFKIAAENAQPFPIVAVQASTSN